MVAPGTSAVQISKISRSGTTLTSDLIAVEEPLEIRIGFTKDGKREHRALSITMRTPGSDFDLAAGFLYSEGIVQTPDQITDIRYCGIPAAGTDQQNTVRVDLSEDANIDLSKLDRHFYTTSSCGVCGKTSLEAVSTVGCRLPLSNTVQVPADIICGLPTTLRSAQDVFDQTGGLHASALFDETGAMTVLREDVGRHNALDKAIGAELMRGNLPLSNSVLLVSGRTSFELVQKVVMAGIPIIAAIGAPSSLAVELAKEFNVTLIGFVREDRFNIYTGPQRIV